MKRMDWIVLASALAFGGCEEQGAPPEGLGPTTEERRPRADEARQGSDARNGQRAQSTREQQQGQQAARVGVLMKEPFGLYLVDADGRALYVFTADTRGERSACSDRCAEAWPPLSTQGEPQPSGDRVSEQMLGTIERRDGTQQVTYDGWPLYTYVRDTQPEQTSGQDVHGFGGEWYLMAPSGEPIEAEGQQHARR